jgi:protein phosphatase 1 regulatory subunit 37
MTDVVEQARACIVQLNRQIRPTSNGLIPLSIPATKGNVVASAKTVLLNLVNAVQSTSDPIRLEELLSANDDLTSALAETTKTTEADRPSLTLHGLGSSISSASSTFSNNSSDIVNGGVPNGNGQVLHSSPVSGAGHEDEPEPTTPKIDKGKGRAEPEPVEHEKVLSPTLLVPESDEEDDDGQEITIEEGEEVGPDLSSPTYR